MCDHPLTHPCESTWITKAVGPQHCKKRGCRSIGLGIHVNLHGSLSTVSKNIARGPLLEAIIPDWTPGTHNDAILIPTGCPKGARMRPTWRQHETRKRRKPNPRFMLFLWHVLNHFGLILISKSLFLCDHLTPKTIFSKSGYLRHVL